jgi:hypothetical protein
LGNLGKAGLDGKGSKLGKQGKFTKLESKVMAKIKNILYNVSRYVAGRGLAEWSDFSVMSIKHCV